ncbi:MAG TPA: tripartite tricarboxylate transporter substrate binding protein [Xanthobacteraceae bacterium]|nr:tripartite tricarboxylate transporter substrate binding protein [Xanthobacteraceae bacterium]
MLQRRQLFRLAGAGTVSALFARSGSADTYPSRPIRWIVPFPAGGTTDLVARLLGQWLSQRLGQQVIVENKPGGGTNVGVQAAVAAPADGYTLLLTLATNTINPSLYKKLPYDFQHDIAPVAGLADLPLILEANPALPIKTVAELIAYAKANPGKLNVASFGARTISDLAIELLQLSAGVDVVRVPYPGDAPMLIDLVSGRVQAAVDALPVSLAHIRAGDVRALALMSAKRSPTLPNVPTVGETIAGFEVKAWTGVGVPRGTPSAVIERLNREINAGLADPGIKAKLAEVGGTPLIYTPSELGALVASETKRWSDLIKRAGIQPQ